MRAQEQELISAATAGNTDRVIELILQGVDVDARDAQQNTPLMWASLYGHTETAKSLLDRGADIEVTNDVRLRALLCAAQNGQTETVALLLDRNAKIGVASYNEYTALVWAAQRNHTATMALLLGRGATIEATPFGDNTPVWAKEQELISAAKAGNTDRVIDLIQEGVDVDARDAQQNTPLMWASLYGHTEMTKSLLDSKADTGANDNITGFTALMWAAKNNRVETAALLLDQGANLDLTANYGRTPLGLAASYGCTGTVKVLLDHGSDIEATDNGGNTALMLAAKISDTEKELDLDTGLTLHCGAARSHGTDTVELLLKHGANIEATTQRGETALIMAAARGNNNAAIAALLLEHGANIEATAQYGATALSHSTSAKFETNILALVTVLLNHGAKTEVTDFNKNTPLINAAIQHDADTVALLLKHGANMEAINNDGNTALIEAACNGKADTAALLLKHGANIEAVNRYGRSALLWAATYGHTDTVALLLKHGANIEANNNDGNTALIEAACNGKADTAALLLKHGANIEAINNYGSTALMLAVRNGKLKSVEMLLLHAASSPTHHVTQSALKHIITTKGCKSALIIFNLVILCGGAIDNKLDDTIDRLKAGLPDHNIPELKHLIIDLSHARKDVIDFCNKCDIKLSRTNLITAHSFLFSSKEVFTLAPHLVLNRFQLLQPVLPRYAELSASAAKQKAPLLLVQIFLQMGVRAAGYRNTFLSILGYLGSPILNPHRASSLRKGSQQLPPPLYDLIVRQDTTAAAAEESPAPR